ncbi:hypothetical protein L195_g028967 [Trifolium pratense]|uniref:Retrotransposon gag domain-containing protein n=2 Tax=Trifolium pratense TaxID=57577 RepID=A0A2K3L3H7_TRIPR|nr:hypothetical protein L195_g028967 [Trifolium pratense]
MRRTGPSELQFDPEIEKTTRANRKAAREALLASRHKATSSGAQNCQEQNFSDMEDEQEPLVHEQPPPPLRRTLGDYGRRDNDALANQGFHPANPVCDYTDPPGVSESDKRLRLFKHSLSGRAKDWLDTIPAGTIETWRQLERKFLDRYFPIHKFLERRAEISNFEQADGETLYDAWERFKVCLKRCPNHGWWIIENRDETEARELVESMAQNEYRATNDRGAKKRGGMLELDTQTALLAQQKLMTSQMEAMMKFQTQASLVGKVENVICDFCLQDHPNGGCFPEGSEEARYLANFRKSYPNNNNGSGWGNMQGQGSAQQRPPSRMEETLNQFMMMTQSNFEAMKSSQETSNKNHEASIKNLEVQMGQLSRQFSMLQNNGGFGGNTLDNPTNESCNGITLRSREILERQVIEKTSKKKMNEGEVEKERDNGVVENMRDEGEVENEKLSREVEVSDDEEVEVEKQRELRKKEKKKSEKGKGVDESPYARVPYPRKKRVKNQDCEKDFKKFMKVLNKLEMAIPLVEALEQMPSYAKFLKELLTKKRKPLDDEMVSMTEECSALIQRKLPQKKKDLGSFTIPCSIGNLTIGKALCDLGASINLMSLSMMKKIPGAVANPTKMSLSLADRSIVNPEGILHDVLVRVAGFVLPADFVVLDIEETSDWKPLLLGRPFLATSRALIDVELGELMQRTEDHQIVFNVFKTMKCYDGDPQCFQVQVYDEMIKEALKLPWKETHLPQGGTLLHNP